MVLTRMCRGLCVLLLVIEYVYDSYLRDDVEPRVMSRVVEPQGALILN
jgi:hypothetical protein